MSAGRKNLGDLVGQQVPEAAPAAAAAVAGAAAAGPPPSAELQRTTGDALVIIPARDIAANRSVLAAFRSAKSEPGQWRPYGVRLPADLAQALKARVAADRIATELWGLSTSHYMEAALSALPFSDPGKIAEIGRAWRAAQPLGPAGRRTSPGTLLRAETARAMLGLSGQLSALDPPVNVQDVAPAALMALLRELDQNPVSTDIPS